MKYYLYINNILEEESTEMEEIKCYITNFVLENITEENWDEIIDECNEEVCICGITFYASEILKQCDNTAYIMGMSDEAYNIANDINYDLETRYESVWSDYEFEIIALPTEMDIDKKDLRLEGNETTEEIEYAINEYLQDYGYCDNGYQYEIQEEIIYVYDIDWDMDYYRE